MASKKVSSAGNQQERSGDKLIVQTVKILIGLVVISVISYTLVNEIIKPLLSLNEGMLNLTVFVLDLVLIFGALKAFGKYLK